MLHVHARSHAYLAQQGLVIKLQLIVHLQTWYYDITARLYHFQLDIMFIIKCLF